MAHEKKLLIDVFQAYFYRRDAEGNRELVFMSENLTSGGIVTSQENTDVRNGQGNTLFAVLPGAKDVSVNLTENVFSFETLKINSAGKESAGAAEAITSLKSYRAGKANLVDGQGGSDAADKKLVKLDKIPLNAKEVVVQIGDVVLETLNKTPGQNVTNVAEGKVFLAKNISGEALDGSEVEVYVVMHADDAAKLTKQRLKIFPFVYKTNELKTQTLTISARDFAEGGELWLQTVEKDEKQKATAYVYFVFDNAMPEGSFEINTVSEVQPNDMSVNMRILANEEGELYRIVREEI